MPPNPNPKQNYYYSIKTHKGMPFLGFLLSIFVYISIFYTFKLSHSNLFNNTKFWFFISNTLILIIAADYGAFSSSSENKGGDLYYEEYVSRKTSQERISSTTSSFVPQDRPKEDVRDVEEEIKEVITSENTQLSVPENKSENQIITTPVHEIPLQIEETKKENKIGEGKKYRRSKSSKVKKVNFDESKNIIIRSSSDTREKFDELTRKKEEEEEEKEEEEEEENEFSSMSNEELNRRVEEFIQRFNRQIRLQRRQDFGIE